MEYGVYKVKIKYKFKKREFFYREFALEINILKNGDRFMQNKSISIFIIYL